MGEIVTVLGIIIVLLPAFEMIENKVSDWKTTAVKMIGGIVIITIGLVAKYFGL